MTLLDLCRIGTTTLAEMDKRGELAMRHRWVAMKGASRYAAAIMAGDVATTGQAAARVEVCADCPIMSRREIEAGVSAMYCGRPFEDRGPAGCGCLVGVTVDGEPLPGGKTAVRSESCPRGAWTGQ